MKERHDTEHWARFEKLWLLAFAVLQLGWLWKCFGEWWFSHVS